MLAVFSNPGRWVRLIFLGFNVQGASCAIDELGFRWGELSHRHRVPVIGVLAQPFFQPSGQEFDASASLH